MGCLGGDQLEEDDVPHSCGRGHGVQLACERHNGRRLPFASQSLVRGMKTRRDRSPWLTFQPLFSVPTIVTAGGTVEA